MIRNEPYWWEAAPPTTLPRHEVRTRSDVVIVGAGYTGLSAALTLARAGRSVQVFDRMRPGEGASTRNGGIASGNLRPGHAELTKTFGAAQADAILLESKAARLDLADFIAREQIECDFKLSGRFTGASTPGDYDRLARDADHVAKLPQWRDAAELAGSVEFLVIPRPGEPSVPFPAPFRGAMLQGFPLGVSSSQIRARVKAGLPVELLTGPVVAEAIRANRLYL